MNNIATVTCVYKNYENFYRTIYLFFFLFHLFRNSFYFPRPFYTRRIQISRSIFGSGSTIRRTLLHLTSTNGWCTTRVKPDRLRPSTVQQLRVLGGSYSCPCFYFRAWIFLSDSGCKLSMLQYSSSSLLRQLTLPFSLPLPSLFFPRLISAPVQELRLSLISSRRDDLVLNVVHGRMNSTRSLPFALHIVVRYQLIIISFR